MEMKSRKVTKRRNIWTEDSERALLKIWMKKLDKLRAFKKTRKILMEIVAEMELQDFKYNIIEIKTKMHNMTSRYRKERIQVRETGIISDWDRYAEMDSLMARLEDDQREITGNDKSNGNECNESWAPEQKWKFSDDMSLLVPRKINTSQNGSDSQYNDSSIGIESEDDGNCDYIGQVSEDVSTKISFISVPENSKYPNNPLLDSYYSRKQKRARLTVELDKNDDLDLFFLSMAKTVKKLPYRNQVLLKKDISDLVFQAELKNI